MGGPKNGVAREERFDITAASEVMAILALASDYADLRHRLGEIVVAESRTGFPIKADDIGAAGPMALLLREAFLPNIVQTIEQDPAFIHAGPFANIAHGNSSIIADRIALGVADYVVPLESPHFITNIIYAYICASLKQSPKSVLSRVG